MKPAKESSKLPAILETHRIGNRGEAFLEFMMSKYCLMNKVVGHRDIGVDYICEWLDGNTPSRILFGIQVKTTERSGIKFLEKGLNEGNRLSQYKITPIPFHIEQKTFKYWEGLNIPLFLFLVTKNENELFDCYYTRLTPLLHKSKGNNSELQKVFFYKANSNSDFKGIIKRTKMDGGFVRDLIMDSIRCAYQNGSVAYRDPLESNINWPSDTIFPEVLGEEGTEYLAKIKKSLKLLEIAKLITISPDFEDKIKMYRELLRAPLSKSRKTID